MVTAMVSPRARPRPRMMPPTMPMRALRSTPMRIISQRVAPSASTASRWFCGTAVSTSRVIDAMIGTIMMARMMPAASMPMPYIGPVKSPVQPRVLARNGSTYSRSSGASTKIRPQSVNHAGNRRQQLHQERDDGAQAYGAHLGDVDRHADRKRHRNQQRQERRNQRAVDERQRSVLVVDRVPIVPVEEAESELVQRKPRLVDQLPDHEHDDGKDRHRRQENQHAKDSIRHACCCAGAWCRIRLQHRRARRRPCAPLRLAPAQESQSSAFASAQRIRRVHRV